MIWSMVGLYFLITVSIFFVYVRNVEAPYRMFDEKYGFATELCELYLVSHLMKKKNIFTIFYKGLPANKYHPRLLLPVITFIGDLLISIAASINAIYLTIEGLEKDPFIANIFTISYGGAIFLWLSVFMLTVTIQNNICFKKMAKMSLAEIVNLRNQIEKEWPGFFDVENKIR